MSEFAQFRLLLRTHLRMLFVKFRGTAQKSRLMAATLIGFLVTYSVSAFFLFSRGLNYIAKMPAAGNLLSDRIIYIVFFCFLLMLLFSVAVTGYISLFRSRDTRWLLTLPISHRVLFIWKCLESAAFSSWGLIFILAPMLVAFAISRQVGALFYLKSILILVPFLIVASAIGSMILISAVRWLSRKQVTWAALALVIAVTGFGFKSLIEDREMRKNGGFSAAVTFHRVLHHTKISVNRGLPSTWFSKSLVSWSRPHQRHKTVLYPTLLIAYALMSVLVVTSAGRRWFYIAWNRSVQFSAISARRRQLKAGQPTRDRLADALPGPAFLRGIIGRPLASISRKDSLTFIREPGHWVQFVIVFGLLAIYAVSLRSMSETLHEPRDLFLVAFLNLAVCALALSTLTTRFVFPQFSLEGRRLWILAMSPLKLPQLVIQKFVISTLFTGTVVTTILLISGINLKLDPINTTFFATAVAVMAIGLNGIAVGFGVLFPNLEETNTAKIVSGFGGTICLVTSFVYIVAFLLLLAWAKMKIFEKNEVATQWFSTQNEVTGVTLAVSLTLLTTTIPLFFSMKRLKRLEILGNL